MSKLKQQAYLGLRYYAPDVVRSFRAALDNGVDGEKTKKALVKKCQTSQEALVLTDALDYIMANPQAGVIRWTEGEQYVFVDEEQPK